MEKISGDMLNLFDVSPEKGKIRFRIHNFEKVYTVRIHNYEKCDYSLYT